MPEHTAQGLDVTAEEQRYLRRTFRRLALPWFALLMAFSWWLSSGNAGGAEPAEDLAAMRVELGELAASLEALSQGVSQADARAAAAAELAGSLEGRRDPAAPGELASLKRDLGRAAGRIAALEKKLGEQSVTQRFDALTDRIAGVEDRLAESRALPAAPAPALAPRPDAAPPPASAP